MRKRKQALCWRSAVQALNATTTSSRLFDWWFRLEWSVASCYNWFCVEGAVLVASSTMGVVARFRPIGAFDLAPLCEVLVRCDLSLCSSICLHLHRLPSMSFIPLNRSICADWVVLHRRDRLLRPAEGWWPQVASAYWTQRSAVLRCTLRNRFYQPHCSKNCFTSMTLEMRDYPWAWKREKIPSMRHQVSSARTRSLTVLALV